MSPRPSPFTLDERHATALRDAAARLGQAPATAAPQAAHRSSRRLALEPVAIGLALATAIGLTLLVWIGQSRILAAWEQIVLGWAGHLGIPLQVLHEGTTRHWTMTLGQEALLPGRATGGITAVLVLLGWMATSWMHDRLTALKYLARSICAVQASAVAVFAFVPAMFPHTAGSHLGAMLQSGYSLMLVIPVVLAFGYVTLDVPLPHKLLGPAAVLAFFLVEVPHKAVLHMLILQHFSLLFMPVLYLFFGLLFDVMLFIALYSWMVSEARLRTAA